MADRSVVVTLKAQVDGFKRAMREAADSAKGVGDKSEDSSKRSSTAAERMVQSATKNREAWDRAGATLVGFGTATIGALGLATKAAIDWESAFAGVKKTVDDSEAGYAALSAELRNMAKELPATHAEIAGVAEAAGQLGVKRKDIIGFTRTMIDLGETTNLSADEAATALARMSNIMGTMTREGALGVARMGSTIVELGNNSATTEREIVELSTRLAAAGKQAGLSEADVFAFASALTSVGVEAEAGGTAMSKVFTKIADSVRDGGDELAIFARVAGVSVDEFKQAFERDAAGAITMFVEGMGRLSASGESTTQVFKDLELTDQRLMRAVLSAGSATGLLTDQLDMSRAAWQDNTALAKEAAQRYETTAAQLQMTKNAITDAAIGFGEVLLPAVRSASEGVRDFAGWLGSLDEGQRRAIVGLAGVTGGVTLAAGAFLLIFPRVLETYKAFKSLQAISPGMASGLGKVGKAAGAAAIALTAANVAFNLLEGSGNAAVQSTSEATAALAKAGLTAEDVDKQIRSLKEANNDAGFDTLQEGLESLANPSLYNRLQDLTREVVSLGSAEGRSARDDLVKQLRATGEALGFLVESGNAELAAQQFKVYEASARAAGMTTDELLDLMPQYRDALKNVETQQTLTATAAAPLKRGFGEVQVSAEDAEDAIKGLNDALDRLLTQAFSVEEAQDAVAQAVISLTDTVKANKDAVKENGVAQQGAAKALEGNSKSALANREALRTLVDRHADVVRALANTGASTDELDKKAADLKEEFYKQAESAGFTRSEVKRYADVLDGVPHQVKTTISATVKDALSQIGLVKRELNQLPNSKNIRVTSTYVGAKLSGPGVAVMQADGGVLERMGTGLVQRYADGGTHLPAIGGQQPQIQPNHGPTGIMWAETGAGPWEAFISGHPAKRDRSVDIWEQTGQKLGVNFVRFDQGGFFSPASSGASVAGPSGPMQISGTLDLGNGLVGVVRGVVRQENREQARAVRSGSGRR